MGVVFRRKMGEWVGGCADFGGADCCFNRPFTFGEETTKTGVMLRHSKHERSGLYDLLSTRARPLRAPFECLRVTCHHTFNKLPVMGRNSRSRVIRESNLCERQSTNLYADGRGLVAAENLWLILQPLQCGGNDPFGINRNVGLKFFHVGVSITICLPKGCYH